jgi:endonuclease III
MPKSRASLAKLLDKLESFYGTQESSWPNDPYLFLIWWHCGYPASDAACAKGWRSLNEKIGVEPREILSATPAALANALKPGGMVPELRAQRLKEVAASVQDEFGGDLRAALAGPIDRARKILKTFPGIGDPGADRILLFAGLAPSAAVPSNCPHVLVRIQRGPEGDNYTKTYREAQQLIESEIPAKLDPQTRAFLLVKRHGQDICKRTQPRCDKCPIRSSCAFAAKSRR